MSSHGKAVVMTTSEQWKTFLQTNQGRLAVVDFSAKWCGPCRMIAPRFAELSQQYADTVAFGSVDVDDMDPAVIQSCDVSAMPTFQFYRRGEVIDEIVGADPNKLRQLIDKYK